MADTRKTNPEAGAAVNADAVTDGASGAGKKSGWAKVWGNFEKKHPKLAKWLYQIFYFFVFSMGVTIIAPKTPSTWASAWFTSISCSCPPSPWRRTS